jgi:hypothetical protein
MADEHEVRRRSIDPDRLLPGEQLDTASAADAGHWIDVYSELLATKRHLVGSLLEMMASQPKDVREELQRADVVMLQLQIKRFEHRLGLWQQRRQTLTEPEPS